MSAAAHYLASALVGLLLAHALCRLIDWVFGRNREPWK